MVASLIYFFDKAVHQGGASGKQKLRKKKLIKFKHIIRFYLNFKL